MKALGVGLGACKWREIEVATAPTAARRRCALARRRAARSPPSAGVTALAAHAHRTPHRVAEAIASLDGSALTGDPDPHARRDGGGRRGARRSPSRCSSSGPAPPWPARALDLLGGALRPPGRGPGRQGQQRRRRPGRGRPAAPARASGSQVVDAGDGPAGLPGVRPRHRRRLRHRLPRRATTPPTSAARRCSRSTSRAASTGSPARRGPGARRATRTVTFAALKPGLAARAGPRARRRGRGRRHRPRRRRAPRAGVVEARRRRRLAARRGRATPTSGAPRVLVVAGSPGMTGAAHLAAAGRPARRCRAWCASARPGVGRRPRPPDRGRRASPARRRLGRGRARRLAPVPGARHRPGPRHGAATTTAPIRDAARLGADLPRSSTATASRPLGARRGGAAARRGRAGRRCSPPTTASTRA